MQLEFLALFIQSNRQELAEIMAYSRKREEQLFDPAELQGIGDLDETTILGAPQFRMARDLLPVYASSRQNLLRTGDSVLCGQVLMSHRDCRGRIRQNNA
jgi:hypothetical protein